MYIPEEVKVGATTYAVKIVDQIRDLNSLSGRIDQRYGEIELEDCESENFLEHIFLHELVHAMHFFMGFGCDEEIVLDETYVEALANTLHMIIKDNPNVFKPK